MSGIALIGGGNMGESLLAGWLTVRAPDEIVVVEPTAARAAYLRETYSVSTSDLAGAVRDADVIVAVVKPYVSDTVMDELAEHVTGGQLVVSAIGGIPTTRIEERLRAPVPVVRTMPNTPVSVRAGMIAISAGKHAGAADLDRVRELLSPVGRVVVVPEKQLDAVTALSGSGPA